MLWPFIKPSRWDCSNEEITTYDFGDIWKKISVNYSLTTLCPYPYSSPPHFSPPPPPPLRILNTGGHVSIILPVSVYKDTGFLYLQYLIDKIIIEHETNLTDLETSVTTLLQRMPYPPYIDDNLNEVLRTSLPIFIVLSFILNALQITRNIAQEKERNLKVSVIVYT